MSDPVTPLPSYYEAHSVADAAEHLRETLKSEAGHIAYVDDEINALINACRAESAAHLATLQAENERIENLRTASIRLHQAERDEFRATVARLDAEQGALKKQLELAIRDVEIVQRLYDGARAVEDVAFGIKDRPVGSAAEVVRTVNRWRVEAQAERDRLRAQVADLTRWQPIETAPKGERVLRFGDNRYAMAGQPTTTIWIGDGSEEQRWHWLRPTHWMPLPAAPREEAKRG